MNSIVPGFDPPQHCPVWLSVANRVAGLLLMRGYRIVPDEGEPTRPFDKVQAGIVELAGTVAGTLLNHAGATIKEAYVYEHRDAPGCVICFVELDCGHMYAKAIPALGGPARLAHRAPLTLQ